jgi:hypothetical protein
MFHNPCPYTVQYANSCLFFPTNTGMKKQNRPLRGLLDRFHLRSNRPLWPEPFPVDTGPQNRALCRWEVDYMTTIIASFKTLERSEWAAETLLNTGMTELRLEQVQGGQHHQGYILSVTCPRSQVKDALAIIRHASDRYL